MIQLCQRLPTFRAFMRIGNPQDLPRDSNGTSPVAISETAIWLFWGLRLARWGLVAGGLIQSAVELDPPGLQALLTAQTGEGEYSVCAGAECARRDSNPNPLTYLA